MTSRDHAVWLESLITEFVATSPDNNLQNAAGDPAFASPLVGFSKGDDPLYQEYKEVVGEYHWTPLEIFSLTFPDQEVAADDLTVISWVLPQTDRTKADNRRENTFPSESWARARIFGEEFNKKIRVYVVEELQNKGIPSVAPMLAPQWEMKGSEKYFLASTWSERHAAHAGGLGTFGLCDGLITPKGKAMRAGSVVALVDAAATPRPYSDHHAYCLFYSHGTCKKCVARCPVDALSDQGHDKVKCLAHLKPGAEEYVKNNYGFDGYGCGLCQVGVPCESKIPLPSEG